MSEIEREVHRRRLLAPQRKLAACTAVLEATSVADQVSAEREDGAQIVRIKRSVWLVTPDGDVRFRAMIDDKEAL